MAYAHIPENEYYGDSIRWFIGTVVDVNDPLKLDRVRVRVYGIHTSDTIDIPNEDLPWASVLIPVTEGGTSGIGANSQIKNRAQVFGVFLDGKDSQCPLIMGSIPKVETKRNDVNEPASKKNEYDGTAKVPGAPPPAVRPGVPSVDDGNLVGKTNIEKAYNFFLSEEGGSFTPNQAAGILGNLIKESSLKGMKGDINPTIFSGARKKDGTLEGSYGIAQWNPSKAAGYRLQELRKYSARSGLNYTTLYAQLKFIIWELSNHPWKGLAQLRKAETIEEASKIFEEKFEAPAPGSTQQRINFANEVNKKLGIGAQPA